MQILTHTMTVLPPYMLDLYIPEVQVGIDCHGLYNTSMEGMVARGAIPDTHSLLTKTLQCERQGIKLYHIYEDEWKF